MASLGTKGITEEGVNIMIGMICLIIAALFIFYLVSVTTTQYEEQSFLESATKLQYAMDYACATGQTQSVNVLMPQKVGNAANSIAAFGDPQYLIYFERFPVGEEWAWTSLALVNYWALGVEGVAFGVATAAVPAGLSKAGGFFKRLKSAGALFDTAADALEGAAKLAPEVQSQKVYYEIDELIGMSQAKSKTSWFMGKLDEAMNLFKNHYSSADEAADAALEIGKGHQKLVPKLEESFGDVLDSLPTATSQAEKNAIKNVILKSDDAWDKPERIKEIIKYIDDNAEEFHQYGNELSMYRDELKTMDDFLENGILPDDIVVKDVTTADIKAYVKAYLEVAKNFKYEQINRNIVIVAAAGKGQWVANKYVFSPLLSLIDKSNEKFVTCGAKSLCAKTPNYIAVYPLTRCEANDYEYVRIVTAKKSTTLSWSDVLPTSWVASTLKGASRFYLASPCGKTFTITPGKCTCHISKEPVYKLNYVADEDGKGSYEEEFAGYMRLCDETISTTAGNCIASGNGQCGFDSEVKCLIVEAGDSLEGYEKDYDNFCYSLPENMKNTEESGFIATTVLIDIGITVGTTGWGGFALSVVNNVFTNIGQAQISEKYLWPKGGGG